MSYNKELESFEKSYTIERHLVVNGKQPSLSVGRDIQTGEKVIIKTLHNYAFKPEEVYLLEKLKNVFGIIQLYDHYNIKFGVHYLVHEYFFGVSLKHFIATNEMSENNARKIMKQLIYIVQDLLNENILHRKIVPRNIFIEPNSLNVKLTNFKSAGLIHSSPRWKLSSLVAPPEYFLKNKYTAEGLMVWSLGLILYELLFNQSCFQFDHDVKFSPIYIPNDQISTDLKFFLHDLLEKDPAKRLSLDNMINHVWIKM